MAIHKFGITPPLTLSIGQQNNTEELVKKFPSRTRSPDPASVIQNISFDHYEDQDAVLHVQLLGQGSSSASLSQFYVRSLYSPATFSLVNQFLSVLT